MVPLRKTRCGKCFRSEPVARVVAHGGGEGSATTRAENRHVAGASNLESKGRRKGSLRARLRGNCPPDVRVRGDASRLGECRRTDHFIIGEGPSANPPRDPGPPQRPLGGPRASGGRSVQRSPELKVRRGRPARGQHRPLGRFDISPVQGGGRPGRSGGWRSKSGRPRSGHLLGSQWGKSRG